MNRKGSDLKGKEPKRVGNYILAETIGRGHYAVVKKARHCVLGEKVAIKIMDKSKVGRCGNEEVSCLKLVQHPNVVRLLEVMETVTELMVVLELGEDGNLYDYVSRHEAGLDEKTARSFFVQMAHAVQHCHRCNVVHRDIKMENMILFNNHTILKLTDFGFSSRYVPGSKLETSCGSLAYSAPEILIGDTYHAPAVDIWSLGVLLFMLVSGSMPFDEATESETLVCILDVRYSLPSHPSPSCLRLITKMLRKDPEERIGVGGVLGEEWVKEGGCGAVMGGGCEGVLGGGCGLSEVEQSFVVHRMAASNIACKDEIMRCLQEEPYSHVSACYHLLAGRLVSKRWNRMMEQALLEKEGEVDGRGLSGGAGIVNGFGVRNDLVAGSNGSELNGLEEYLAETKSTHKLLMEMSVGGGGESEKNSVEVGRLNGEGRGKGNRPVLSGLQEASEDEEDEEEDGLKGADMSASLFGGVQRAGAYRSTTHPCTSLTS